MSLPKILAVVIVGLMVGLPYFVLTPPLKVAEAPAGSVKHARRLISQTAAAGQAAFAGSCADCHGEAGAGGSAPAIDSMSFAQSFEASKDLHDAVVLAIPAHADLIASVGDGNEKNRFNDVELMGKFLREMRTAAQASDEN